MIVTGNTVPSGTVTFFTSTTCMVDVYSEPISSFNFSAVFTSATALEYSAGTSLIVAFTAFPSLSVAVVTAVTTPDTLTLG